MADDSTRVTLQSAIDHALELFNGNSTDTNAINQSITDLQTASDDVNASMNALAAQNQQQQQQQSNTGNSYNYQYTRPSGGLTPPAPITPGNNPGSDSDSSSGSQTPSDQGVL